MDSAERSVAKSVSWRIVATILTAVVVYLYTGALTTSVELTVAIAVSSTILYYFHERFWTHVVWGLRRVK